MNVYSGSYHSGPCPDVTPMANFYMNGFLGKWYVIQKTLSSTKCLTYNFTKTDEPLNYKIDQVYEDPILSFLKINYKCHHAGKLSVKQQDIPSRMVLKFPFDLVDNTSYIIITTDYRNYAAIFACQKLILCHYQSVSILSRQKTLPQSTLVELRAKIGSFGINPYDLNFIEQSDCYDDNVNEINMNNQTSTLLNMENAENGSWFWS
ncbi:apolipoprotein D-like [Lycorma delicatula]|uniref:apolipoprotein D-like n=1 Tax=Lycorma delicatula TaxID=130591 RepID=UPI003F5123A9